MKENIRYCVMLLLAFLSAFAAIQLGRAREERRLQAYELPKVIYDSAGVNWFVESTNIDNEVIYTNKYTSRFQIRISLRASK